jgi:hypothetical protein
MTAITVTCPQAIRAKNRQANNRKRERDPERRAIVKAWCMGKLCSCGCGMPANTAHHISDDLYADDEAYRDLANCEPYYHLCHRAHHRGYERCPICRGWMRKGSESCYKCRGVVWRSPRRAGLFPCSWRKNDQRCLSPIRFSGVCDRSRMNCTGCDHFMARVAV